MYICYECGGGRGRYCFLLVFPNPGCIDNKLAPVYLPSQIIRRQWLHFYLLLFLDRLLCTLICLVWIAAFLVF